MKYLCRTLKLPVLCIRNSYIISSSSCYPRSARRILLCRNPLKTCMHLQNFHSMKPLHDQPVNTEKSDGDYFFQLKEATVTALGDRIKLVYAQAGPTDGKMVVMVHGSPGTHKGFQNIAAPLAEQGYNVVVPNFPGGGWTPIPTSGCYDFSPLHRLHIIQGLMETLEYKKAAAPWGIKRSLLKMLYSVSQLPVLGTMAKKIGNSYFDKIGLGARSLDAQIYSMKEMSTLDFVGATPYARLIHKKKMPTLFVGGNGDHLLRFEIVEELQAGLGLSEENTVWYHSSGRSKEGFKDDALRRAVLIDGGDHNMYKKRADVIGPELLDFIRAVEKSDEDRSET